MCGEVHRGSAEGRLVQRNATLHTLQTRPDYRPGATMDPSGAIVAMVRPWQKRELPYSTSRGRLLPRPAVQAQPVAGEADGLDHLVEARRRKNQETGEVTIVTNWWFTQVWSRAVAMTALHAGEKRALDLCKPWPSR